MLHKGVTGLRPLELRAFVNNTLGVPFLAHALVNSFPDDRLVD